MLAGLVGTVVAAGLLLRGAWDLWAQSALVLLLSAGGAVWLAGRAAVGWMPRPEPRLLAWAGALAAASAVSALMSPVPAYARSAWIASTAGLALFPLVSVMDSEARERLERILRAGAWVLVLLAVYQRLQGDERPAASLPNQNVFAGVVLLLLPIAARAGDWGLTAGLLACLWWARSVGGWLGLSAALLLHRRAVGPLAYWFGAAAGFVGLVAAYAKLESPESLHRLAWWGAAWRMSLDNPWIGLGPGSYAYALPAYVPARPELSSLYAHQHALETAAERGWPYAALWLAGLVAWLVPARPGRRFGPVAALVHGLVDYALALPGVFWLFCVSTALAAPASGDGVNVPSRRKPMACGLILAAAAAAAIAVWRDWSADRLRAAAAEAARRGRLEEADSRLAEAERLSAHPEGSRMRAEIALVRGGAAPGPRELDAAIGHLRRAVAQDPYRSSNRILLEAVERRRGGR